MDSSGPAEMNWVAELPPDRRGGATFSSPIQPIVDALRQRPGQWVEFARYPKDRRAVANTRGWRIRQRHPDVEYATRNVADGQVALFLRAVTP